MNKFLTLFLLTIFILSSHIYLASCSSKRRAKDENEGEKVVNKAFAISKTILSKSQHSGSASESFFQALREALEEEDDSDNIRVLARNSDYLTMVKYIYGNRCKYLPDHKKNNKAGKFQKSVDDLITKVSQAAISRAKTPVTSATDTSSQTHITADNDEGSGTIVTVSS